MAIISSLLFTGAVIGIREGIIIAALVTGPFVKLLSKYAKPITNWFAAARYTNAVIANKDMFMHQCLTKCIAPSNIIALTRQPHNKKSN